MEYTHPGWSDDFWWNILTQGGQMISDEVYWPRVVKWFLMKYTQPGWSNDFWLSMYAQPGWSNDFRWCILSQGGQMISDGVYYSHRVVKWFLMVHTHPGWSNDFWWSILTQGGQMIFWTIKWVLHTVYYSIFCQLTMPPTCW